MCFFLYLIKKLHKKSAQLLGRTLSPVLCAIINIKDGGGRGIRTPARFNPPVGFQDRSLQPDLGIPPYRQEIEYHIPIISVNTRLTIFLFRCNNFFIPHIWT
jgi:hypothetical protein